MGKACVAVCSDKNEFALWCLWIVVFPLLFGGITLGSLFACYYVKENRVRNLYTNTSCLLLNYALNGRLCQKCDESCYSYVCFNEEFFVSYKHSNQTLINTSVMAYEPQSKHNQTQIGMSYSCFYHRKNATSVIWNLPEQGIHLSTLLIAYGIAALFIILIVIALWHQRTKKYSKIGQIVQDAPKFFEAPLVE